MRTVSTAYRGTPSARSRIRFAQIVREARDEPVEEIAHRWARERLEVERGEVALPGAPVRPLVANSGRASTRTKSGRLRDHSSRYSRKSSRPGVRPLHVLEDEDRRRLLREALEQDAPGREEVLLVAGCALLEPEQVGEAGLDPAPLFRIGDVLLDRASAASAGADGRLLVLDDPAAHPHHLGKRPVGHALAVGEAAATMPEDVRGEPVDVLLELPREPRLADAGDAR